ncbi:MAG: LytTR family DNA-binding domain-containing protein [Calditrichales bacterium]|nr:LytTR family DNA-binding domain-containing protein [Calditrichales bacterium]
MNKATKKISCIIVDDEALARQVVREYTEKHSDLEILAEYGDPLEAYADINRFKPDLIFLDIQMPEINGFELLEKLNDSPVVIFCTAYDEHAIKAFEKNAIDYLLKPFNQNRFDQALDKARKYLGSEIIVQDFNQLFSYLKQDKTDVSRLLVKDGDQLVIIEPEEIIRIEAQDDYCLLHTRKGKFLVSKTMQQLENRFSDFSFCRVHRSTMVNLNFVKEIQPWSSGRYLLIMKNGDKVESSKSGARAIKEMIL